MKKPIHILALTLLLLIGSAFAPQPDAQSFYNNGVKALNTKDYIKAIGEFTNAITMNPKYADAYFYRAYAKELLGVKMGFVSSELNADLIMAMYYGKKEALPKVEKSCMNECYSIEDIATDPENIYCLNLNSKNLNALPAGTTNLKYVVKIDAANNKLKTMTPEWEKLDKLVNLDLSGNDILTVSPSIGKLTFLRELYLSKNEIKALPNEIGNLKNLRTLSLRQNGLTQFPATIAMLGSLENLDLNLNHLKTLPNEIANLKKLKTLSLVGNDLPVAEQQKIKALLPNTTIYFE